MAMGMGITQAIIIMDTTMVMAITMERDQLSQVLDTMDSDILSTPMVADIDMDILVELLPLSQLRTVRTI